MRRAGFIVLMAVLWMAMAAVAHATPEQSVGDLTIEQVIEAAIAEQQSEAAVSVTPLRPVYTIAVEFSTFSVHLFDPEGKEIFVSAVALPRFSVRLPVEGWVTAIERNPSWYPTPNIKKRTLEKEGIVLPDRVPPGPNNPMGPVKFTFNFTTPWAIDLSKLHGTNHPESIGRRASSGCIRMFNDEAISLADLVEPHFKAGVRIKILYVDTLEDEVVRIASR